MIKTRKVSHGPYYVAVEKEFCEEPYLGKKADRAEELYTQEVTFNGNIYDAGERSMDRIDRVLTLANSLMNATVTGKIAAGSTTQVAQLESYKEVYQDRILYWVMSDNSVKPINAETLIAVQDMAMAGMQALWLKYG
jgi:uncharacterized protein YjcR